MDSKKPLLSLVISHRSRWLWTSSLCFYWSLLASTRRLSSLLHLGERVAHGICCALVSLRALGVLFISRHWRRPNPFWRVSLRQYRKRTSFSQFLPEVTALGIACHSRRVFCRRMYDWLRHRKLDSLCFSSPLSFHLRALGDGWAASWSHCMKAEHSL